MEILSPDVLGLLLVLGIIVLGIGVYLEKLTLPTFGTIATAWVGVHILLSVPVGSASRLVGAGFEIDLRVQQAEEALQRLESAENKISDLGTDVRKAEELVERLESAENKISALGAQVQKAEDLVKRIESAEKTITRLETEAKITFNTNRRNLLEIALLLLEDKLDDVELALESLADDALTHTDEWQRLTSARQSAKNRKTELEHTIEELNAENKKLKSNIIYE